MKIINKVSWEKYLAPAAVILTAAIVYANCLHNPFIWDEEIIIINNPIIKQLTNLPLLFKTSIWGGAVGLDGYWRPMYMLSFMFDYHFWKLNTVGYHIFAIVFHVINALLLYVLAQKIGLSQGFSSCWRCSGRITDRAESCQQPRGSSSCFFSSWKVLARMPRAGS